MDFAQTIEFEESVKSKLESKERLLHVKEEKLGNEIVRMEFDQIIKFEENLKPKLEFKEGLMRIKSPVHVVLVSLLVDQLSGLFLTFFGRPKKICSVSGNFWSVSEFFLVRL